MDVFYEYVASETGAFRLVFESDLTNEPAVREHVERVTTECAAMIAHVIHDDTGLPDDASRLLAVSLVGMAQVSARFWLSDPGGIGQPDAAALVAGLAWRGIRGYPLDRRALITSAPHPRRSTTKEDLVEVKIGVQNAARELTIDVDDAAGRRREADRRRGRRRRRAHPHRHQGPPVIVPVAKLAYVELGHGVAGQVGFRS